MAGPGPGRRRGGLNAVPSTSRGAPHAVALDVPDIGRVSALSIRPERAIAVLALAHGSGAGMRHPFMEALAGRLAERGIATLRYQFPYMELRVGRPDPPAVLVATVRAAVAMASREHEDLPVFAGGKSLGGRMTSTAQAETPLPGVRGIAFFGFPLHPAGRPATSRSAHLDSVSVPMLFLQGTRDALAEIMLVRQVCERLGAHASLRVIEDADHSFHVPKRAGTGDDEVLDRLADAAGEWMRGILGLGKGRGR